MYLRLPIIALLHTIASAATAAPDGASLYSEHCAVCHGASGTGGVGIPLAVDSLLSIVSDDYLKKTIRLGRPGRIMPAFPKLSDAQINAIISHLRGWSDRKLEIMPEKPVRGDARHGMVLYAEHCASCHGKDGEGGKGTGVTFSRPRDMDIIPPALNNPGFQSATCDHMIQQTLIVGREGTPMTSFLEEGLTEQDINDIVRYVRTFYSEDDPDARTGEDLPPTLIVESPYSLEETVENAKQAISGKNFRFIRTQPLEEGLVPEGEENSRQVMIYFCNFNFLFEALAKDPRIGMFLPCRITVVERDGVVQVMSVNPMYLSKLFNNEELHEDCRTMTGIYRELLDEISL